MFHSKSKSCILMIVAEQVEASEATLTADVAGAQDINMYHNLCASSPGGLIVLGSCANVAKSAIFISRLSFLSPPLLSIFFLLLPLFLSPSFPLLYFPPLFSCPPFPFPSVPFSLFPFSSSFLLIDVSMLTCQLPLAAPPFTLHSPLLPLYQLPQPVSSSYRRIDNGVFKCSPAVLISAPFLFCIYNINLQLTINFDI